ncbi:MAG TPA: NUDIX hydrolase [Candidatus Humimicrobiaceae bacterium]|nr:NUDIX hydrolase [Candidatus Humimicrobiaceae bacterium]
MRAPKSPILTADGIILEKDKVLLLKRALRPFFGSWTLPGGHVEYGETVEKAVKREMKEELGVTVKIKKLFGVYSDPKRDPRYHTTSVVYLLGKTKGKIRINEESSEFKYFSLKSLPKKIGFDHRQILNDLKKKL